MPTPRGIVRRPNVGKGQTTTTSVSFSNSDKLYVEEQARMRNCSFALIIGEAITLHRRAMNEALNEVESEDRSAKARSAQAIGAQKRTAGAATSTPPTDSPVEL